jgi:hypothetical protein
MVKCALPAAFMEATTLWERSVTEETLEAEAEAEAGVAAPRPRLASRATAALTHVTVRLMDKDARR